MASRRSDSGDFRRRASQIIKDNIVGGASIKFENRRSRLKSISLIQEEPEPKKTIKKEQKIRFNGRFKNVALWIPLDVRIKLFKYIESNKKFKSILFLIDESCKFQKGLNLN